MLHDELDYVDLIANLDFRLNVYGMTLTRYAKTCATSKKQLCIILTDDYKNWCNEYKVKYYAEENGHALIAIDDWLAAYKDDRAPAIVLDASHLSATRFLPIEFLNIIQFEFQDHVEIIE
jgi:hypothetical protein